MNHLNIGRAIKLCRTQRGLSQGELAQLADISVSYLSLLERDKRDPTFSTIEAIAFAVDVPIVLIFYLADDEAKEMFDDKLNGMLSVAVLEAVRS